MKTIKKSKQITLREMLILVLDQPHYMKIGPHKEFSPEQLGEMEEFIKCSHFDGYNPPELAIYYGILFGETLIKNFSGAHWTNLNTTDLRAMTIAIPSNVNPKEESIKVLPMVRAEKFAMDHDYTFTSMYKWIDLTRNISAEKMERLFQNNKTN